MKIKALISSYCTADLRLCLHMQIVFIARQAQTDHNDRSTVHLFGMLVMVTVYLLFFTWRANLDVNSPLLLGVVSDVIFFFFTNA